MLAELYGQTHITAYAKKALADNHFPHSLLLTGQGGYGLFKTGWAIAKYLMCKDRGEDVCGVCSNCSKVKNLQHPDLHIFFPTASSKDTPSTFMAAFREFAQSNEFPDYNDWLEHLDANNKTLNLNAKTISEILHAFSFKNFEEGPRVFLIWGAEFFGKEGNKLLKVIEEPPEDAYIIMMTENRKAILSTILSRCQTMMLKPLNSDETLRALNLEATPDHVRQAELANGSLKQMSRLLTTDVDTHHNLWLSYMRAAFKGHPGEVMDHAMSIADQGKQQCRQFSQYGTRLVSQMLKCNMGIPTEADAAVEKLARLLSFENLEALNQRLQEDYIYIGRNANLKLLFASQSLWLTELFRKRKKSLARM